MPRKTIGNPLSWTAQALGGAAGHVGESVEAIGGEETGTPKVQKLSMDDLRDVLRMGWADLAEARADAIFIVAVYPVIGLLLLGFATNMAALPLLFPLVAGFVLLGPLAAVGLYEISRRREAGETPNWSAALRVFGSPNFAALVTLGLFHLVVFGAWLMIAMAIYSWTLGPEPPASLGAFLSATLTTGAGWTMIILGTGIGFLFALVVLATSVVSYPLLLDRHVGVPTAIAASREVFAKNRRVILSWGLIVAVALFLGSLPALVGLIVVMPVLGHATWHLYRRAVTWE